MAQKLITRLTDDITGKEVPVGDGETFEFAFGGYAYTIDLDTRNAKKFRDAMTPYINHGRRTGKATTGPLRRSEPARRDSVDVDPAQVRAWAEANGYQVSPRGRIKADIVEAYRTAHA